ncbi:MAG: hypothetical protein A3K18_26110 [Lentisphaerae bacterium RIFOXYA12_64_32]|nr:MAG: hypothetical protein A3K18_26110 [Lentisphaerae bacterium RIFOXYA12_64_32]
MSNVTLKPSDSSITLEDFTEALGEKKGTEAFEALDKQDGNAGDDIFDVDGYAAKAKARLQSGGLNAVMKEIGPETERLNNAEAAARKRGLSSAKKFASAEAAIAAKVAEGMAAIDDVHTPPTTSKASLTRDDFIAAFGNPKKGAAAFDSLNQLDGNKDDAVVDVDGLAKSIALEQQSGGVDAVVAKFGLAIDGINMAKRMAKDASLVDKFERAEKAIAGALEKAASSASKK